MIVTIDGPAGAGKSTVARLLAERLGFERLDTGALYRVVALAAMRAQIDIGDHQAVVTLAGTLEIDFRAGHVWLGEEDVSSQIRTPEVSGNTSKVASIPAIRQQLDLIQRRIAAGKDLVTEGRDQGTVVFPQAECKIFLTASVDERAVRRVQQLRELGQEADFESIRRQQIERDERDSSREVAPLVAAEDAEEVVTDGLSIDQVVARLADLATRRRSAVSSTNSANSTNSTSSATS